MLAELGQLRSDDGLAITLAWVLPEIALVIVLRAVKRLQGHHLGHDGRVPDFAVQFRYALSSDSFCPGVW